MNAPTPFSTGLKGPGIDPAGRGAERAERPQPVSNAGSLKEAENLGSEAAAVGNRAITQVNAKHGLLYRRETHGQGLE
jgi:hypothetical protein